MWSPLTFEPIEFQIFFLYRFIMVGNFRHRLAQSVHMLWIIYQNMKYSTILTLPEATPQCMHSIYVHASHFESHFESRNDIPLHLLIATTCRWKTYFQFYGDHVYIKPALNCHPKTNQNRPSGVPNRTFSGATTLSLRLSPLTAVQAKASGASAPTARLQGSKERWRSNWKVGPFTGMLASSPWDGKPWKTCFLFRKDVKGCEIWGSLRWFWCNWWRKRSFSLGFWRKRYIWLLDVVGFWRMPWS